MNQLNHKKNLKNQLKKVPLILIQLNSEDSLFQVIKSI
jgi:hypothetical protein